MIVHKGSIFHFLVDMIVGQRQKAYKQVNSTMDWREATDGECYDYTSFISGFESNRKCLVCHEDLFKKCCKTKEEGRTCARNCFVLEHSLCWECGHYIDHVHRVIPHVVLNAGGPFVFFQEFWIWVLPQYIYWRNDLVCVILSLERTLQNSLFEWNALSIAEI